MVNARTCLVTGAGGFIGSHVVELMLRRGYSVRALIHYNSSGSWGHLRDFELNPDPQLTVMAGDVADPRCVDEAVDGCNVVLHLAALIGIPYSYRAAESYVRTNINGTLNVLEACRKLKTRRLVITSTSEVYGTARFTPITEDHPLQGQSPYAATKIAADKLGESFFRSFGLPVITLRPFNTYGPRQSARAIIPTVLCQALSNSEEIHLGSLAPKRDLTFVEDTAHAFLLAAEAEGVEGEVIHFGQGKAISVGELAQRCQEIAGSHARIVPCEERKRPEKSEVNLLLCEPSKAKKLLGWSPQTSLAEGLRHTADYIRKHPGEYRSKQYQI